MYAGARVNRGRILSARARWKREFPHSPHLPTPYKKATHANITHIRFGARFLSSGRRWRIAQRVRAHKFR